MIAKKKVMKHMMSYWALGLVSIVLHIHSMYLSS